MTLRRSDRPARYDIMRYRANGCPDRPRRSESRTVRRRSLADGLIVLDRCEFDEWKRVRELMMAYADSPMDLADASLVAVAERRGLRRIFSLDRHFYGYRIAGQQSFEILP